MSSLLLSRKQLIGLWWWCGVECSPTDAEDLGSNPGVSASVSVTLTLDIGLSYLSILPVHFAKLKMCFFFPLLPLLSSSVCKLYKVNKCSFCLYSLSLSLLEPNSQDETVATRLQWRKRKTRRQLKPRNVRTSRFETWPASDPFDLEWVSNLLTLWSELQNLSLSGFNVT